MERLGVYVQELSLAFMDQAFLTDLKSAEDQKVEIRSDISNTFFGDDRESMRIEAVFSVKQLLEEQTVESAVEGIAKCQWNEWF